MGKYPDDTPGAVRWVEREVDVPHRMGLPKFKKVTLVLQQEWRDKVTGDTMWRDVPVEAE